MKDPTKVNSARTPKPRRKAVKAWRPDQEPRRRHLRLVPPREADMGIRLVMEAAGHAPDRLTWRERYVLLVLASSAMDATRECPPGIEANHDIARRLHLSRTQMYVVLDALCEKGALVRLERGRNGVKAVYAIAPFDPATGSERPGDPDARPVDNPLKGPGTRDASESAKGPGSVNEGSRFEAPKSPGSRDPSAGAPSFREVKGFKTGGGPPDPQPSLFPFGLPVDTEEEGVPARDDKPGPEQDIRSLADEIRKIRPEWSVRSIVRALERPAVAERPWVVAAEAMRIIAADPETQHPGRLEHDGPWWAEAARRVLGSSPKKPPWCGRCDQETRMTGMDGREKPRRCRVCHPLSTGAA